MSERKGEKICKNCRHYIQTDPICLYGRCPELVEKTDLVVDGDAVAHLDIDYDFGCVLFKEKEVSQ